MATKPMKPEPEERPTKGEPTLLPIKDWASAPKLPPDHWIHKGGPQMTFVGGLGPSTEFAETSPEAGIRVKRVGKFTPEQWADELSKLGWKNGNEEIKGPKAFELPGFPNSQPKQG